MEEEGSLPSSYDRRRSSLTDINLWKVQGNS